MQMTLHSMYRRLALEPVALSLMKESFQLTSLDAKLMKVLKRQISIPTERCVSHHMPINTL